MNWQYCDGQQTQNPGRVEKGVPCLGWGMEKGGQLWVCGFGAPPGARLFPRQRCRSAVAAHTAGTESTKGNWGKPLLSTAVSPSERGEVTGRNKAKAQAWIRL